MQLVDADQCFAGEIDSEIVSEEHFGGGLFTKKVPGSNNVEGGEERQKTRKEVMEEIIAKSKFYKAQKAKQKSEQELLTKQLDDEMSTIRMILAPNMRNKHNPSLEDAQQDAPKPKLDDYDMAVRELGFEMRAKATDRLKTPEEIAREERLRLEALEVISNIALLRLII